MLFLIFISFKILFVFVIMVTNEFESIDFENYFVGFLLLLGFELTQEEEVRQREILLAKFEKHKHIKKRLYRTLKENNLLV